MEESINLITQPHPSNPQTTLSQKAPSQHISHQPHQEQNPLISSPFSQYFTHRLKTNAKLYELGDKYNRQLQNKLQHDIVEGDIKVSLKKKKFKLRKDPSPTPEEQLKKEKEKFKERKQSVMEDLHQVYQEQKQLLVKNNSLIRSRVVGRSVSSLLCYPSQNWLEEIRKAIKKHRRFKSNVKRKDMQAKEREEYIKHDYNAHQLQKIHKLQESNHQEIQKKAALYRKFKRDSEELQKKCDKFIQRLKPSRYKHLVIAEEFTESMRKVQSERSLQLQNFRRKRQVDDWQSVKQHEERYLESVEKRKQLWLEQFNSFRDEHRSRLHHYQGKYAERARAEEQELKQQAERKVQNKHKIIEKIRNYDEYVHQNFKPKHFKQQINNPQLLGTPKRTQMDRTQIRLKGLQYLNKVKQTVKSFRTRPDSQVVRKSASLPKIESKTVYPDYLKDLPGRRKRQPDMNQFHNALTERKGKWAQSALSLISRMEMCDFKKGDKPLISSVFNKIELLNAMNRDK